MAVATLMATMTFAQAYEWKEVKRNDPEPTDLMYVDANEAARYTATMEAERPGLEYYIVVNSYDENKGKYSFVEGKSGQRGYMYWSEVSWYGYDGKGYVVYAAPSTKQESVIFLTAKGKDEPFTVKESEEMEFNIQLFGKTEDGTVPLANRTISFYFNGEMVDNFITSEQGEVIGIFKANDEKFKVAPGTYTIQAKFDGDEEYQACEGKVVTLIVNPDKEPVWEWKSLNSEEAQMEPEDFAPGISTEETQPLDYLHKMQEKYQYVCVVYDRVTEGENYVYNSIYGVDRYESTGWITYAYLMGQWGSNGILFYPALKAAPTALEGVEMDAKINKVMRNGQLIIIHDGVMYDAQGNQVK